MAKKEEIYRGKSIAELKAMDLKELMPLLSSRQRRTLKRGLNDEQKNLLKMLKEQREGRYKKPVKTHLRDMIILPEMVGQQIQVHNGKEFVLFVISFEMIGRYLGEYAHTRKKVAHSSPGIGATKSSGSLSVK